MTFDEKFDVIHFNMLIKVNNNFIITFVDWMKMVDGFHFVVGYEEEEKITFFHIVHI